MKCPRCGEPESGEFFHWKPTKTNDLIHPRSECHNCGYKDP